MFISLVKGQEELKTLLVEEKKKKTKKITGVLNMGRRFQGQARRTLDFAMSSGEKDNQDGKGKETFVPSESESEEEEEDYSEEQYPLANDMYKHLEERLRVWTWFQMKASRTMRKNGETWLKEFNPLYLRENW